ncbi:MAG: DoxX family protein [Flavobacteriales bacterium]
MKIKTTYFNFTDKLSKLNDLPLLAMRLVLAYGFYIPAMNKWEDINAVGDWFASMNYPLPYFSAYLAASAEGLGVILLTLGLAMRFITIPLIITMTIAIISVHWENGFEGGSNNGFEIPLYYITMLTTLFINGAGRISLDFIIRKVTKK